MNSSAAIPVPAIVNAAINTPNDVDRYKVKVGSDQKLVCSVGARRYGSPLDALVAVHAGDNLIAQKKALPMVVVTPLGYGTSTGPAGGRTADNIIGYTTALPRAG